MGLSRPARALLDSRVLKLACIGALSEQEIATQLRISEKQVRRILTRHYDSIQKFNERIDTALTHTEAAHFHAARTLLFTSLQKVAYRLDEMLDSRDPRLVLEAVDRLTTATGLAHAPRDTAPPSSTLPTTYIDKLLVALQAPVPTPPLPTGLPPEHPLSAQRLAPDASSNPPSETHDALADAGPSGATPNLGQSTVLVSRGRPGLSSGGSDPSTHTRFVPVLESS